jgi:hypothetical protein
MAVADALRATGEGVGTVEEITTGILNSAKVFRGFLANGEMAIHTVDSCVWYSMR